MDIESEIKELADFCWDNPNYQDVEDEIREFVHKLQSAQQSVQLTGAWCPNCNLPPDEFGDCIRCGEPIAPATNA